MGCSRNWPSGRWSSLFILPISGSTLTDQGGTLLLAGAPAGTIDYGNGIYHGRLAYTVLLLRPARTWVGFPHDQL